jgi:hypothetical protein
MAAKKMSSKKAMPAKKKAAPTAMGAGLTPAQKKLPPFIQKAILSKKTAKKK